MKKLQKITSLSVLIMIIAIAPFDRVKAVENTEFQNNETEQSSRNLYSLHTIILDQNIPTDEKIKLMENLLNSNSVSINDLDDNGRTALNLATFYNAKPIIIQFLLENKADVNLQDRFNETPLHNAIRKEELIVAQMLLQADANENFKNDKLETPIDLARSPKTLALFGFKE